MNAGRLALFVLPLLVACSGARTDDEVRPTDTPAGAPTSPPPEHIGDAPVPTAGTLEGEAQPAPIDGPTTPEGLYGSCKERVEGVQIAGECTTDADCAKVGCSQEVCVPAKLAGEVVTTCEVLPCFRALDTCGCHDGMCSWTIKAELPAPGKLPLPTK